MQSGSSIIQWATKLTTMLPSFAHLEALRYTDSSTVWFNCSTILVQAFDSTVTPRLTAQWCFKLFAGCQWPCNAVEHQQGGNPLSCNPHCCWLLDVKIGERASKVSLSASQSSIIGRTACGAGLAAADWPPDCHTVNHLVPKKCEAESRQSSTGCKIRSIPLFCSPLSSPPGSPSGAS